MFMGGLAINDMYRGNTPLVRDCFRKCYFAIVHKVLPPDKENPVKTYINYFVQYSEDLVPVKFSKPFKYQGLTILVKKVRGGPAGRGASREGRGGADGLWPYGRNGVCDIEEP